MYSRDVHFHRKEEEKARIALEISKLQEEIVASKRAALKGSTIADRQEMEGLLVLMLMLRSRNFSHNHEDIVPMGLPVLVLIARAALVLEY